MASFCLRRPRGQVPTYIHCYRPPRSKYPSTFKLFVSWDLTPEAAALRQGLGVGVIADVIGHQSPDLVRVPTPHPAPEPQVVYLVGHAASRHTPRVVAVWDFLEDWSAALR